MISLVVLSLFVSLGDGTWEVNTNDFNEPPQRVRHLLVGSNGHVYFADFSSKRIYHLNEKGAFLRAFGRSGEGPGEFANPFFLTIWREKNQLYVADSSKEKMVVFDSKGQALVESIPVRDQGMPQKPFVINSNQALIISETLGLAEESRGKGARVLKRFGDGRPDQVIATMSSEQHQDWLLLPRGGFKLPWSRSTLLAVSPDHETFYLGGNDTLNMVRYRTKDLKILGKVQDTAIAKYPVEKETVDDLLATFRTMGQKVTKSDLKVPKFKPAIKQVFVDEEGRLWVRLNKSSNQKGRHYRVYNLSGTLQGKLVLMKEKLFHADQRFYWSSFENENGDMVIAKRRYQLENP